VTSLEIGKNYSLKSWNSGKEKSIAKLPMRALIRSKSNSRKPKERIISEPKNQIIIHANFVLVFQLFRKL
jgi:hypothetical protein